MTAALAERPVLVVTERKKRQVYAADQLTLAAVPTALSCARMFIRFTLQNWRIDRKHIETAELLVSELVSIAIEATGEPEPPPARHGPIRPLNLIRLRLLLFADSVVIEVWDSDPRPPMPQAPRPDTEDSRGPALVARMSRQWNYYLARNGGKVVWCELGLVPMPADHATIEFPRPLSRRKRYTGPVHPTEVMNDPDLLKRVLDGLQALDSDDESED
jgi:hypothetical protein